MTSIYQEREAEKKKGHKVLKALNVTMTDESKSGKLPWTIFHWLDLFSGNAPFF